MHNFSCRFFKLIAKPIILQQFSESAILQEKYGAKDKKKGRLTFCYEKPGKVYAISLSAVQDVLYTTDGSARDIEDESLHANRQNRRQASNYGSSGDDNNNDDGNNNKSVKKLGVHHVGMQHQAEEEKEKETVNLINLVIYIYINQII